MTSMALSAHGSDPRIVALFSLCLLGFMFGSFCLFNLSTACRRRMHESCFSEQQALCLLSLTDTDPYRQWEYADSPTWCDEDSMDRIRAMLHESSTDD